MNKDLTVGNPKTVLLRFCLPLFGSVIFQQLYNIADSFVAGKYIGNNALAAVGNSYEITLIFMAFAFGSNIGCSVIVSRLFGEKNNKDLRTAVYTTFIASGILCLILMVSGLLFSNQFLELIHTPDDIFEGSKQYLRIYILGLPFIFFYNISTGIFSALGDSQTPFIFLVCSSISNICMDIVFVSSFDMGIAGVAWATFICQGISCLAALVFVIKRLRKLQCHEKPSLFSYKILKEILIISIPTILQQSFISVGNIIIQSVINNFGSAVIAGYSASVKLNNMMITSLTTFGNGISNYSAQNLGAKKLMRIKEGFSAGLRIVWIICIPVSLAYFALGGKLVFLFLENKEGLAVNVGAMFLKIVAPFYLVVATKLVSDGVLRGMAKMKQFMIGTFSDLIIRVVLAVILSKTILGTTGIWLSWPVGWTVATVISCIFYKRCVSKENQQ